jgi:hypothetical protein
MTSTTWQDRRRLADLDEERTQHREIDAAEPSGGGPADGRSTPSTSSWRSSRWSAAVKLSNS